MEWNERIEGIGNLFILRIPPNVFDACVRCRLLSARRGADNSVYVYDIQSTAARFDHENKREDLAFQRSKRNKGKITRFRGGRWIRE
jgi:hypothetical protein